MPLLTVALVRSDQNGNFASSADWSAIPAIYKEPSGLVNFEIDAADGTRSLSWDLSLTGPAHSAGTATHPWRTARAVSSGGMSQQATHLNFDLGRRSGVTVVDSATIVVQGGTTTIGQGFVSMPIRVVALVPREAPAPAWRGSAASPDIVACQWSPTSTIYHGNLEHFANIYAWAGAFAEVIEGITSTHTLGIAVKSDTGSWGQSGSTSVDINSSINRVSSYSNVSDAQLFNQEDYRPYEFACVGHVSYQARPYRPYALLSHFTYAGDQYFSHCATYGTGGHIATSSATNVTYGGGVTLGFVSVNAQAGWGDSVSVGWNVTAPSIACGSNAGPASAVQVEVHSA